MATFSFPGVSQTIVKTSTWGQCPQVLAGTARKIAKSTRLCSYTRLSSSEKSAPKSVFGKVRAPQYQKTLFGALFGALPARCPKALQKQSLGHFVALAPGSCRWRMGLQGSCTIVLMCLYVLCTDFRMVHFKVSRIPKSGSE